MSNRAPADLLGYTLLTLVLLNFNDQVSAAGATCKDVNGLQFETGHHYIPGPEPCTLCICDNGNPIHCKAVFCKYKDPVPNKDCKTFLCCELICLNNAVSSTTNDKSDGYDFSELRLVASCVFIFLTFGFFVFFVYRMMTRTIRGGGQSNQLPEDQRSLGSMGYLDRNNLQHGVPMDDIPCNGGYPLWKPPSNYFPRGEAPPPYEEAVAAARAEQALLSINPHTLSPLNFPGTYLTTHNTHANISIVTNSQNGLPASSPTLSHNNATSLSPLITNSRPLSSPAAHSCYQLNQTAESVNPDFCAGNCSSFVTNSNYESLSTPASRSALSNTSITPQHTVSVSNQLLLPNSQNSPAQNYQNHHTTLPRQGAFTISSTLPHSNASVHRTIPRSLASSGSLRSRKEYLMQQSSTPVFDTPLIFSENKIGNEKSSPRSTNSTSIIPSSIPSASSSTDAAVKTNAFYDSSCTRDLPSTSSTKTAEVKSVDTFPTLCNYKPPLVAANEVNEEGSFDSVTCTCNVQNLPPLHDEADDYRSECENCKSATGSRYYLDNEDELVTSPHETMTLQRRPEDAASNVTPQYYRTSLTLPTNTRQRTRSGSSRGNWFGSMPESSTESSDGE